LRIDTGIVKAEAFSGGTFTAGNIIMGAGGSISGGTWSLSNAGLSIPDGGITAQKLTLQNSANILKPEHADFEFNPASIASFVAASNATLTVDSTPANVKFNAQSLKVVPTLSSGWVWMGLGNTDWNQFQVNPSTTYIVSFYAMIPTGGTAQGIVPAIRYGTTPGNSLDASGASQSVPANSTWARYTTTCAVGATSTGPAALWFSFNSLGTIYFDGIQVEEKVSNATTASAWKPPGITKMDGGFISTGAIRSINDTANVNPTTGLYEPVWSIPLNGAATFSGLRVLGNTVLGNGPSDSTSILSSSNFSLGDATTPGVGWQLQANGQAIFKTVTADGFTGAIIAKNLDNTSDGYGSTVELNGTGFYVRGSNAKGNPEYITFPTTGAPNIISGTLQASTLNVNGLLDSNGILQGASFRGLSHIELGAEYTLDNAVAGPISAPSATEYTPYDFFSQANVLWDLVFDASNSTYWRIYNNAGTYQFKQINTAGTGVSQTVTPQAPTASGSYPATNAECRGITKVGGSFYAVWYSSNTTIGAMAIVKYDGSWNISTVVYQALASGYTQALGNDGTNLILVIASRNASNAPFVETRNPTTLAVSSSINLAAGSWPVSVHNADTIFGVSMGNFDYGAPTILIGFNNNVNGTLISQIRAYSSTGIRQTTREWPLEHSDFSNGFDWNGVAAPGAVGFYEASGFGKYTYNGTMWTTESPVHGFAYSWYSVNGRTVTATTGAIGSAVLTAAAGTFKSSDVGAEWQRTVGSAIPANGKIVSVATDGTTATLDVTATVATASVTIQIAYETTVSPIVSKTMRKRRQVVITGAAGPTGTVMKIYAGRSATVGATPVTSDLHYNVTLGGGFISQTQQVVGFTGVAPKVPGTFASGTPARLYSQQTYSYTVTPVTTAGNTTISGTGSIPVFTPDMVGASITGTNIPANTKIVAVATNRISATLSQAATGGTFNNITMTLTSPSIELKGDGYVNVEKLYSRQTILTSTQDVTATSNNMPPLRIGDINGEHLRIDGNELQAMDTDTLPGQFIINQGGGPVKLGIGSQAFTTIDMGFKALAAGPGGQDTVAHNLNGTPDVVLAMPFTSGAFRHVQVSARTSTNFTIQVLDAAGAAVANSTLQIFWMAVIL
ncbi:MAG TPA: hypothetical protein VMR98_01775, partial [Candidatus Polarisedimenticolaceae bacterium]|nr:hypothetical protein [Candidatus Polarisedimenticolaceae bacterium]